MQTRNAPLPSLTSLRFFAALAILVLHCEGYFGIPKPFVRGVFNTQPVSFFFVLSGFIMYYCYPVLDSWKDRTLFWGARISRIWPSHVLGMAIAFAGTFLATADYAVFQSTSLENMKVFLANLFLVQSWIPSSQYYASYYSHAWSISVEMFFYLLFPLLVLNGFKRPGLWLTGALTVVLSTMLLCGVFKVPDYQTGLNNLTTSAFFHTGPTTRIFEFILGMICAKLFLKNKQTRKAPETSENPQKLQGTLFELLAIAILLVNMRMSIALGWSLSSSWTTGLAAWLVHSGSCFSAAFLIYVFAQHQGALSKFLSKKFWIFLGEISFTMYMIHGHYMIAFRKSSHPLVELPTVLQFPLYLAGTLGLSYLIWKFFEVPSRNYLFQKLKASLKS